MNKTINQYINQLHLDPKREAAVRKLVESVSQSNEDTDLDNSGGTDCNCPIIINLNDLHNDGTPVPLSRDTAKQIFDGAVVILKDDNIWYLVNSINTHGENFPCNLYLRVFTDDNIFNAEYVYNDEYQQIEFPPEPA